MTRRTIPTRRVSPLPDAIISWSERAIEKEQRRRGSNFAPAQAGLRFHLEFRNGTVDVAGSRLLRRATSEVIVDVADSPEDLAKLAGTPLADKLAPKAPQVEIRDPYSSEQHCGPAGRGSVIRAPSV
jgi:hypothetical protein